MATDQTLLKRRAAERALDLVESGMLLGLGTGSTAEQFVNALASKIRAGELSDIECVATSTRIESYAEERGLRCRSLGKTRELDLAVDGADEVDGQLRLVKGRGGALLREKIVAQASKIFAVIVDESKLVDRLGAGPLPVEVTAFAADRLLVMFDGMGLNPSPRLADVGWLITDEGNRIIDVSVPTDRDIAEVVGEMKQWAGVIDTGFFSHEASCVVIAGESGVRSIERKGGD